MFTLLQSQGDLEDALSISVTVLSTSLELNETLYLHAFLTKHDHYLRKMWMTPKEREISDEGQKTGRRG